jgi:hypothetical protein
LFVGFARTPYVERCEQLPPSQRPFRRPRSWWRLIRNLEVGRTAFVVRRCDASPSWPDRVGRSAGRNVSSPSRQRGGKAAGCSRRIGSPTSRGARQWPAAC